MSKTYRTGIIGCGKRGHVHIPGLKADERCEVVAVADVSQEAAEAMRDEFDSHPAVYTDHLEMLKNEDIDFIVACLWTPLHLPVFKDCVEAGIKFVHSEKPMAPTYGECIAMAELAESSGTQLTFSHQRRYCKGNRAVRQMIADGLFGDIKRLDLYSPPNLLDCGTHTFDQAMSFMDETPAKWVHGAVDTTDMVDWFNVKAEGMFTGLVYFENGVRAPVQIGGPDKDLHTGVRVIGDKGFIEVQWDGQCDHGVIYSDPEWKPPTFERDGEATMIAMMKDIFDCAETGKQADVDYRKARRAADIIFAFYESVRQHKRIELPTTIRDNPFLAMLEDGRFKD